MKDSSDTAAIFGVISPGATVYWQNERYVVVSLLDINSVLIRHSANGGLSRVLYKELQYSPSEGQPKRSPRDLMDIPDEAWALANERFELIQPLVASGYMPTQKEIQAHAKVVNKPPTTLYRWVRNYLLSGQMNGLLRQTRLDKGAKKIPKRQEEITLQAIKDVYLNGQKRKVSKVIREVKIRCDLEKIEPPHPNTIRNRVAALSAREVLEARQGKKVAREALDLYQGQYDEATYPLKIVQMDHTDMDVIIVDELHRLPIGRPWLTLEIDVFSRMVCGFYVSLDAPSVLSVGMCLAQAMLPKENFLARYDIQTSWDAWGKPDCLYTDNGADFRSVTLQRSCEQYGIDLQYRPLGRPNFGGHIEALMGTVMKEVHDLPGTTFSNIQARGQYDSEGHACMTLAELEQWLTHFIVEVYNQRKHSALNTSPAAKFREGILGTKDKPGRGMLTRPINEYRLRLDFLPVFDRTVQQYGILLDNIYYYHEILQRWVGEKNPSPGSRGGKFIVRRDPRDISIIYFFDPITVEYYEIPYRDLSHPAVNIWEFEAARKFAIEHGAKEINEDVIFAAYRRMQEIVETAQKETKRTRRMRERKADHQRQPSVKNLSSGREPKGSKTESETPAVPQRKIRPFDIEE